VISHPRRAPIRLPASLSRDVCADKYLLKLLRYMILGTQLYNCPRTGSLTGDASDPESRPAQ